jgi:transposase-like protein
MTNVPEPAATDTLREVIRIDDRQIKSHLDQVVRESVEQTLNALLDAEADDLCRAKRYERSPERLDTRAGTTTLRGCCGVSDIQRPGGLGPRALRPSRPGTST